LDKDQRPGKSLSIQGFTMLVRHTILLLLALPGVTFCLGCSSGGASPAADGAGTSSEQAAAPKGGLTPLPAKAKDAKKGDQGDSQSPPPAADAKGEATSGANASQPPTEADAAPPVDVQALLPELAAGFQSPFSVQVFEAAEKFRHLPAEARRNVLAELSAHESANVRHNAWRAFATWATREDVPTLIAALQSPHEDVHTAALELIARFPNEETIGVLTKLLEDGAFRERAEALLVRVGPAAEGAVLVYIDHMDAALRSASWRVLGEIGTRKSLLALERLATQQPFQKDAELKGVLSKIRERLRK
jgi:hypothetical protein